MYKKFLMVAEKREYWSILEKDPEDLTIKRDDQKKLNSLAYNDLMLAMAEDVYFGLVDEACRTFLLIFSKSIWLLYVLALSCSFFGTYLTKSNFDFVQL